MKVYITGISGFLSINLVRYLLARGDAELSGIDLVDFDYPERDRITFRQGDIRDPQAVREGLAGADVVVHTAAALPLYPPEEIYSTEVEGTRTVLQQALECGVKRFIHISSTAVYLLLTERFDADPFLLFTLRGRTQDKVLAALQAERGGAQPTRKAAAIPVAPAPSETTTPEPPVVPFVPLSETVAEFWRARTPLEDLPAGVTAAAIPDALIRAWEEPAFWSGPGRLRDHLSAVYQTVAREALILADGGRSSPNARAVPERSAVAANDLIPSRGCDCDHKHSGVKKDLFSSPTVRPGVSCGSAHRNAI